MPYMRLEISQTERQRILEMHKTAIKNNLFEQNYVESIGNNPIAACIADNADIGDAARAAGFFLKCDSCRRIVWLAGMEGMKTGKIPSAQEIAEILMKTPEITNLSMPCAQEIIKYMGDMSDDEKRELTNKMKTIVTCVVNKVLKKELPLPDDIDIPSGPTQFPNSGGIGDVINKGIETAGDIFKNMGYPNQPTGQFPK